MSGDGHRSLSLCICQSTALTFKRVCRLFYLGVHVLNAVQTKHGGEFGQKAAQERNKSGKPALLSLLAVLPKTEKTVIWCELIRQSVVTAVGKEERGEATQLH